MFTNAKAKVRTAVLLATASLVIAGCANLDERTVSTKAPVKMAAQDILEATKRQKSSFVDRIKDVLPKKAPQPLIAEQIIPDDDPTRLDHEPTKPLGPELYIAAARLSEKSGRYDVALEQYQMALQADSRNRNALIGLARLRHRAGKVDEAIRIYRDALNTYRNDAVIMNDLGLCYVRNNQLGEAISMLQAATQAAPGREMYVNNLAAALVEANRGGEAVAHLSRLNGPAVANYKVGYLFNRAGRKGESVQYLNKALALNPNLEPARTLLTDNTPRVSALPRSPVPVQQERYEIPVTSRPQNELQPPLRSLAPQGDFTPAAPTEPLPYLQQPADRFGPFGFAPKPRIDDLQLVTYIEEPGD